MFKAKHSFNRVGQVKSEPKAAAQKEPEVPRSTSTYEEVHCDGHSICPDNDDVCNDGGPVLNLEKDDMLARRTGSNQKPSGNQFNAFLLKPRGVSGEKKSGSEQYQSNLKTGGKEKTQKRFGTSRR